MRALFSGLNTHKPVDTSDASGLWGCGAFWQRLWSQVHITAWGRATHANSICIRCDNAAVLAILRSGTSKDKLAIHLMRCLAFFHAEFNLSLEAEHLPSRLNAAANALSTHPLPAGVSRSPMLITLCTYKDSTRLDIRDLEEDSILEKV